MVVSCSHVIIVTIKISGVNNIPLQKKPWIMNYDCFSKLCVMGSHPGPFPWLRRANLCVRKFSTVQVNCCNRDLLKSRKFLLNVNSQRRCRIILLCGEYFCTFHHIAVITVRQYFVSKNIPYRHGFCVHSMAMTQGMLRR